MKEQEVIDNLKQFVTIRKIKFAKTFLQQSLGLMFRDCIPHDFGVWFEFEKPKTVIVHSCFMKFDIDILFFNEKYKLIKLIKGMKPWKFVKMKSVKGFLEIKSTNN